MNAADGTNRLDIPSSGAAVNDNKWHHLAASFHRSGDLVLYQDGVEVGRSAMSGIGSLNSAIPLAIGRVDDGGYPYAGLLDDVRVYGYALSQAEIARLMQGGVCIVTSNADSGAGTLRTALEDPTCETIGFDNDYTITLASQLMIYRSVVVDGGGHNIILSGNNTSRVLDVSGYDVTLNHLTLREGHIASCNMLLDYETYWGAGIYNDGTGKTLTINNSTITGNVSHGCPGGGIANGLTNLNLFNTLVSNNQVSPYWGGGLYAMSGGPVHIVNSTFASNSSPYGGGLVNDNGSATIANSTFADNTSSDGGAIADRGGSAATTTAYNTVFANNSGGNCTVQAPSGGFSNLADDGTCGGTFTTSSGIALGTLGTLGWYGGSTQTFSLLPGSAAIDAGDPGVCAAASGPNSLDERGLPRNDLQCDAGAFELKYADSHTVYRPVSSTSRTTFGPALMGIQRDATPPFTDPGVITVTKSLTWKTKPANAIDAYWLITPTVDSGFNLTMTLCYTDTESNGLTLPALRFWRHTAGAWSQVGDAPTTFSDGFGNHCAAIPAVDTLGAWTLATSQPTALHLTAWRATSAGGLSDLAWWAILAGLSAVVGIVLIRRAHRRSVQGKT